MNEAPQNAYPSHDVHIPIDWQMPEDLLSPQASDRQMLSALECLNMHYHCTRPEKISTFLNIYPDLIDDLEKIYQTKCQYFDESPLLLFCVDETASLEYATLAAYIETETPEAKTKDVFAQFDKEWSKNISKEAKRRIMVDIV
jgi:hypothetical protein